VHFLIEPTTRRVAELESRVASGETISHADLDERYAADRKTTNRLEAWLKSKGFDIFYRSADGESLHAAAAADTVESTLGLGQPAPDARRSTRPKAAGAATLPRGVAASMRHIGGLELLCNFQNSHALEGRSTLPSRKVRKRPLLADDVLATYGAKLPFSGRGQEIAVITDTFPRSQDLAAFWKANGQPVNHRRIVKIRVTGEKLPKPHGEESIDVEWASGIAPGATVRIYATGSLDLPDFARALDAVIADARVRPRLRQVSISFGVGEADLVKQQPHDLEILRRRFLKLAALGVNVFVSSGDEGARPLGAMPFAPRRLQTQYPASDPHVIAVGGTTLVLATDGSVISETGWPGSGGGVSKRFARPRWQGAVMRRSRPGRLVPDVSLAADPRHGALVIFGGKRGTVGGTSWSAPVWAGLCAILNEARLAAGRGPLPYLNPHLYPLLGTACFRDIAGGDNNGYRSAPGFDLVTGLGTPNLGELIARLT
jgi:kumamolisin